MRYPCEARNDAANSVQINGNAIIFPEWIGQLGSRSLAPADRVELASAMGYSTQTASVRSPTTIQWVSAE